MKTQRIFPGVLLIGVGCYYLLQQISIPFHQQLLSWPSLLLVIGIAFLLQAYFGRETSMIFPGVLLTGLAIHFHFDSLVSWWPSHWGMYTLIVGIAFLFSYLRSKKDGLLPAVILLGISLFSFTSINPFLWLQEGFSFMRSLWPIFLIGVGLFLLFKKK
ncbi:LiaI-LiaF-like domain-containing protein [Halalkalibacter alkalisediminis]|uniref:LiaI-LiaF-like domain-containing protein n=1 Tax=Halalkalibacter alkalisediminis TaxID=935616 RepID=A0ABV6NAU7_9BACI|nr:DUF5668 domain-containing protein [Halalkalibacter alkalisediminis]